MSEAMIKMGYYSDVTAMCNKLESDYKLFCEKALGALVKECEKVPARGYKEFGEYQQEKICDIFEDAIDEFYDAYDPAYYDRNYDMYDVLKLKTDEFGMVSSDYPYTDILDPTAMQGDRMGGVPLFSLVFLEGWHGGARSISSSKAAAWGTHPSPGTPRYRRPGRTFNGRGRWHKYGKWGDKAFQSEAPLWIFSDNLTVAESGEIYDMFKQIFQKHADNAVKKVANEDIPKLFASIFG